jgi:hypothetical protein
MRVGEIYENKSYILTLKEYIGSDIWRVLVSPKFYVGNGGEFMHRVSGQRIHEGYILKTL